MKPTNNVTCTPGTTTCEMYNRDCFPCPWNRYGIGCEMFWKDIDPINYLVAHVLYALIGLVLFVGFAQRLWSRRKQLRSAAGWRVPDKMWLIYACATLLFALEFLVHPLYGSHSPPYFVSRILDILVTLLMVQGTILIVVEWVAIMKVKGRITTKSDTLLRLQKICSVLLWSISIFSTVMEQASVCFKTNQKLPVLRRSCTFLEFTGAHNTTWNSIKNLNHALITTVVSGVGSFAGRRILHKLQHSTNKKTTKTLRKFMNYLYLLYLGVFISLLYALITSGLRLHHEYFYEFPKCGILATYFYGAQVLQIVIFIGVLIVTKDVAPKASSVVTQGSCSDGSDGSSGNTSRSNATKSTELVKSTETVVLNELVDIDIACRTDITCNRAAEVDRKKRSLF